MKKPHELAILAARKYLSPQTGFIHYGYQAVDAGRYDTIPIIENFYYALALFKTKTQENIALGADLTSKLIAFQNSEGNFPVYLHEFPSVNDAFITLHTIPVLEKILHDYGRVIKPEQKKKFLESLIKMKKSLEKEYREKKPKGLTAFKTEKILQLPKTAAVCFSHICTPSQILDFPDQWRRFWHSSLNVFAGPPFKEYQQGYAPKAELINVLLATEPEALDNPAYIRASILDDFKELFPENLPIFESDKTPYEWAMKKDREYTYSVIAKDRSDPAFSHPACHLLRFISAGKKHLHSLSLPGSVGDRASFSIQDNVIEILISLDEPPVLDDQNKQKELFFYVDLGSSVTLNHEKSTVFKLGEPLLIDFESVTCELEIRLVDGKGDFSGHIPRSNRPSQVSQNDVFDHIIYLRTLRRDSKVTLSFRLKIL